MGMEIASCDHPADRKFRRPVLMLKDYLLDDLSSCSSSGFKSFPRRPQCCPSTAPRFLLDIDLRAAPGRASGSSKRVGHQDRYLKRSPSKAAAAAAVSALHRASLRIINAVKLLPFPSSVAASSPAAKTRSRRSLLPRSLSRKLLRKRFWRRAEAEKAEETSQWRPFREFLAVKDPPSRDQDIPKGATTSSSGHNGGGNSSWDSSEFSAADTVSTFSANSDRSATDAAISAGSDLRLPPKTEEERVKDEKVSGRVGATVGSNEVEESPEATPTTACSKNWPNEEKEQFSPVSILDCPFKDDDDEEEIISSTSEYSPEHVGCPRKTNGLKTRRIKSLSQLEPLNLDERLAFSELGDAPLESALHMYSSPSSTEYVEEEEEDISVRAGELLKAIRMNYPDIGFEEDLLLSDFFIEKLEGGRMCELEAIEVAQDWVGGRPRELWTRWEVKSGRAAYVRDMEEKCEGWRDSKEERKEVAVETEVEIWRGLMEEILLDL